MQLRPGRGSLAAVALAAWLCLPAAAQGAPKRPPIEVENLRAGFTTTAGSNNLFKVGSWTPVWIQLRGGEQRFSGYMEIDVPDDGGTPTTVRQPIDVGAGESVRVTAYVRPGTTDPEFGIRLFDPSRRIRTPRYTGSSANVRFDAIRADETLLLSLGNAQGVEMIPNLPGFSVDKSMPDRGLVIARLDAMSGYLPGRWYGYDGIRAVVLDTNNREVMSALDGLRGKALVDWVARGGHLVVAIGSNWQQVRDGVLAPILPAVPTGQERVTDLRGIESFAAGATKPITQAGGEAVMVTKLEEIEERGGKVLSRTVGVPLIVRGSHGFGRVTVVALDVDQRPFSTWEDRPLFWVRTLDLRRLVADDAASSPTARGGRLIQSGVNDLSQRLREALEQFQGVKLISFGWVAFFIFLYILLIGPGDYLFLKKVLKRMELTWVTFPLIVISVSLLAYYAAYVVKGNELRVNKVDVIDVLQTPGPENAVPPSGLVRGSSFLDVFSPQNRDYGMAVIPVPPDRDAPAGADAPARPPAGTEVMLSWFNAPDPGFGGMGNSGRMSFSGGGYEYQPMGSAEKIDGIRIPIWSTKCLTARWFGPAPAAPLIESDLRPAGPDRLQGTVANRTGTVLHDTIVAFNKQVYILGEIQPGATVRVELNQDRQLSGHLRSRLQKYLPTQPYYNNYNNDPGTTINRPDLMLGLMFHDAVANATSEATVASNVLFGLDLTGMLQLDRPMLVARVDRAGSRLVLDNAPSPPKIEQTTLLRVILPLKPAEDAARTKPVASP